MDKQNKRKIILEACDKIKEVLVVLKKYNCYGVERLKGNLAILEEQLIYTLLKSKDD